MSLHIDEIVENIFHAHFERQHELTSTLLRFQEHYESPEFKGKVFTLDEFKEWYTQNSPEGQETGKFTYYTDWSGFNLPSPALNPFFEGHFDPLSEQEAEFLSRFDQQRGDRFYVIGTYGKIVKATLRHEIAHGLFYLRPDYKQRQLEIVDEIPAEDKEAFSQYLASQGGYHPDVHADEVHAHLLADLGIISRDVKKADSFRKAHRALERVFREYVQQEYWLSRNGRPVLVS